MRLAILETGAPPDDLVERYGDYPAMFRRLLLGEGDSAETFDVTAGRLPADPSAFDACLVTGSSAGVYDPLPWIAPLKAFLTAASGRTALVGVCFGHQVMAEAFGGRVIKSPTGWGVGLHRYETRPGGWLSDLPALAVAASHQDQVVDLHRTPGWWPPATLRPSAPCTIRSAGRSRSSFTRSSSPPTPGP